MAKVFDLSPTQSAFVHTDAHIAILTGPMGEGKTFAGAVGCLRHAERCGRDIRGALIRDTHTNIKLFTIPSLKEALGSLVTFHDDSRLMVIHSTPKVEMDLFGIDDPGALSKLQGPEYALIWLEEPAPIIEKANAGLPRDVFDLAVARASRQKGTVPRVQITQNPADEDHWTEEIINAPRIFARDEETGLCIIKEVFRIPYGDNTYLNPLARVANKAAFAHDAGKYARYVEGRAAPVSKGKPVISNYNPSLHFSDTELPVQDGCPGVRGWDGWHSPVCIIGQLAPPGRLIVHDVCMQDNSAVTELITSTVIPMLESPKYKGKIHQWRDIGDPSMRTPDQSTRSESASRTIERLLATRFEPGPSRWNARIEPLRVALHQLAPDGLPKIIISKSARLLHRALNGGWHWRTDNNGNIVGSVPDKNDQLNHIGDAFSYMVSRIFPLVSAETDLKRLVRRAGRRAERLAASYGPAARQAAAGLSFFGR